VTPLDVVDATRPLSQIELPMHPQCCSARKARAVD